MSEKTSDKNFEKNDKKTENRTKSDTKEPQNEGTHTSNTETENNVTDLKAKKQTTEDQQAQLRNDYLYLRAEFENYKRNTLKERSDLLRYAGEKLAYDLLSILDIFEKALESGANVESAKSFFDGMQLTAKELKTLLEKHGIKEIPAQNTKFDPKFHEALTQVPSKDIAKEHVVDVFRKGYMFHDKVLRPAQVTVSKGSDN